MGETAHRQYCFGPFRIGAAERLLRRGEQVVPLPPKAIDTLLILASNSGRVVEKAEIIEAVWPDTFVEEGGLARNISLLRKALGGEPEGHAYIETIPRRGYRFVAPAATGSGEPAGQYRTLAVLPLANLSGDSADEYFADGMTDALISYFMKIEAIRVASRTSIQAYKGAGKRLAEIARELDVDVIVEGTVLQSGGRVRITARLIDGGDEKHLWSGTFEKQLSDVLGLQSEVARDVAREIRVKLSPPEQEMLTTVQVVHPGAYQDYLRGRFFWSQRTRESLGKARGYFESAIKKDSSYAPAYAGLADTYALLGSTGYDVMPPHESMPRARDAAIRAIALDPSLAEAQVALGLVKLVYEWDWEGAEEALLRATALNPRCAAAYQWRGELLMARARADEATQALGRAVDLDPLSVPCNLGLGWAYYFAKRHDEARTQFQRTLELAPNLPMALYGLALTYYHQHQPGTGLAVLRQADVSTGGEPAAIMLLAVSAAFIGDRETARQNLERLHETARNIYVPAVYFAFIHATRNELDQAFDWLYRAYDERSSYLIFLRVQPALHGLRADPRYFELVRRMGL
ncbi:MAG: winged helix-turn-helix domain-containing protein [Bryobacterales bacterium]|nr:winged helix-turn-helix domain-containing protein [Bryobacterales bacterium]